MARDPTPDDPTPAVLEALRGVLEPLARLAVARGLPYAQVDEALKLAFVDAARQAQPAVSAHRSVSRIATATGLTRREVTRLVHSTPPARRRSRSIASEVFAHWQAMPAYRGRDGRPLALPRQGPAPSFESLAHEVTRDVHPRSLLDELLRLGLATVDEASDTVRLQREGFVPGSDGLRMLQLLGDNVGDHASAAVDNVLRDGRAHFEQAVFADGLSAASMAELRPLIAAQWRLLLQAFVPPLERMVEADAATAAPRRVRIGLYAYDEPVAGAAASPDPAATAAAPPAPRRRGRKKTGDRA